LNPYYKDSAPAALKIKVAAPEICPARALDKFCQKKHLHSQNAYNNIAKIAACQTSSLPNQQPARQRLK
jgi:hypothetical protein